MSRLTLFLLLKAVVRGLIILFYHIGLSPDEAQYWTWSRHLDWGYYSKPPAIAWQIWGTTALLGNNELGVRLGALLIGFALALTVYLLARNCALDEKKAFWAAIAMAFSPLGIYLSLAATTDGGAILFLLLAVTIIAKGPNYPLAGVMILFGALYKWIAFAFWPFALLFMLFYPQMRRWSIVWGILISLVALLPPLYWNFSHEWATFKHVGGALGNSPRGNFFDFLAAQIGLISPIFFVILVIALFKRKSRPLNICAAFPIAALIYLGTAIFQKVQPNWAAYLYPPGMVLIGWQGRRLWLHIGTWLSIAMVIAAFLLPWYTFRHSVGWNRVAPALEQAGYNPKTDFLIADKYQATSILSFYAPEQRQAYFFNVSGTRKNQFSFWPQPKGDQGYFVVFERLKSGSAEWYERHYLERLAPYFDSVNYEGKYHLYGDKYALIFKGVGYRGEVPQDPNKY